MTPKTIIQTRELQAIPQDEVFGSNKNYRAIELGDNTYFIDLDQADSVLSGESPRLARAYRQKSKQLVDGAFIVQEVSSVPLTRRLALELIENERARSLERLMERGKSMTLEELEELSEKQSDEILIQGF